MLADLHDASVGLAVLDASAHGLPPSAKLRALQDVEFASAATLAGSTAGRKFSPWFWSDQYDTKLQIAGVSQGYDRVVRRPARREGGQSIWYLKAGKLIAVDAINDPASYMTGRRLIDAGVTPAPEEIADPAFALVKLVGRSA